MRDSKIFSTAFGIVDPSSCDVIINSLLFQLPVEQWFTDGHQSHTEIIRVVFFL